MATKSKKKEPLVETFVKLVKEQLDFQQMTRAELARQAKVGRGYLYRVLDGEQTPSFDWAEKVAKVLGISIKFSTAK